ncbi:MAG: hypothetical protein MdMp014T_0932 [Treponematales bacterium]
MSVSEIQDELFRIEYPNLLPGYDPDIEQYYYLRSLGRSADAIAIFQNRIKPRYPHDEFRTDLLRSYRNRSPRFKALLAVGYRMLGARSLERIKRVITYIASRVSSYDPKDAYSTIKTAEDILRLLPQEKYEALANVRRYLRYADTLNFHTGAVHKAAELVRAYLNHSLAVVEEERRRQADMRRQAKEEERQRRVKASLEGSLFQEEYNDGSPIDVSTVSFSPAELKKIELSERIRGPEEQTLAYCVKYWNLVDDAEFERRVFLYSRKYGRQNFDIYKIIARGRHRNWRDDDILASVMSSLVKGYYYSVRGDRYLQRQWAAIKDAMEQTLQPAPSRSQGMRKMASMAPRLTKRSGRTQPGRGGKAKTGTGGKAGWRAAARSGETASGGETKSGSVLDRLRQLSGHSYDIYQERFLAQSRSSIRKVLGEGKGLFFTVPEKAEDLIYNFLKAHYADPFMNWEKSEERRSLELLGFSLGSLNPIIDDCYRKL